MIELEKSLDALNAGWTTVAEGRSEDGEVRLNAPFDPRRSSRLLPR